MLVDVLADFVQSTPFADIPSDVANHAKHVVWDTVGCCFGAADTELAKTIVDVCAGDSAGQSTIIGFSSRTSCAEAAFANGVNANLIDFNDTILDPVGHLSSEVVPVALAIAERVHASGRELIAAVTLGYEVAMRIGTACGYSKDLMKTLGPLSLPTYHIFGSVAAAGRLLGLSSTELANALGMAATVTAMPGGGLVGLKTSYMGKSVNHGYSARNAVTVALLAKRGLDAPRAFLESEEEEVAFSKRCRSDRFDASPIKDGLGSTWFVRKNHLKPLPSCRWTHAPTTALRAILASERIDPDAIEQIVIESFWWAISKSSKSPSTMAEGIYSTPYALVMTLLGVPPGPEWYAPSLMNDPRVRALMAKVVLVEDVEATRALPGRQRAKATVKLADRTLSASIEHMHGAPEHPLSEVEVAAKFVALATPIMSHDVARQLADSLSGLVRVADVAGLISQLSRPAH